jgi:PAS domain S-box-containing protein
MAQAKSKHRTARQIATLQARLSELQETLDAIRSGAVDALVVAGPDGDQIFTLKGADESYRVLVEAMNEGAVTVDGEGTILYSNTRFAMLLKTPLEKVLGVPLPGFIALAERDRFRDFLKHSAQRNATLETTLLAADGSEYTVLISANPLTVSDLAGICIVVTDITDRKIMEKAQRDLAKNIIEAQENERQRVARELHDGVNQLLSSTKHRLHDLEDRLVGQHRPLRRNLIETRQLVERTITEIRAISRNLRPSELDDLGLLPAMRVLGTEFRTRNRIRANFRLGDRVPSLPPLIELTIYRITQEALGNVEKHSRATAVEVRLAFSPTAAVLRVKDDGCGFAGQAPQNGSHWGLINMRERASHVNGRLQVRSQAGRGTEIELTIPL